MGTLGRRPDRARATRGPTAGRSRRGARRSALAVCAAAASFAACAKDAVEEAPTRGERYAILRDLVLFDRPKRLGGPFFLDRFETTQADWEGWLAARAHPQPAWASFSFWNERRDPVLPVVGVDQHEARAFARWRFGRLPSFDEWGYAATAGGSYRYPWGDTARPSWANTQELSLPRLTPVGAFESGRQTGGPYDLIGNAAEWTSTIVGTALPDAAELSPPFAEALPPGRLRVLSWWIGAATWSWRVDLGTLPVLVVGGGPTRPMSGAHLSEPHFWADEEWRRWPKFPTERGSFLGLRVASDPRTLLRALLAERELPDARSLALLRRFLRKPAHLALLRAELSRRPRWLRNGGALAPVLREELQP